MRNLIALAFVLALAAPAWSQTATTGSETADRVFDAIEKKIIEDFFDKPATETDTTAKGKKKKKNRDSRVEMEAGTSGKRDELPPGLIKHMEKHGTLPPGLARKELPPGLIDRLPPTESGLERLIVDDDVLLVEAATGTVLDIIKDIVTERDK